MPTNVRTLIALFLSGILCSCDPPRYTIDPKLSMADVLHFDKPANLFPIRIENHSSHWLDTYGQPLAAYHFGDSQATEYSYTISVFKIGEAFGEKRKSQEAFSIELQKKMQSAGNKKAKPVGFREQSERQVLHVFLGAGPGGEGSGLLFKHRTAPIEILVVQHIAYFDPPADGASKPDAKPRINVHDAVDALENMVTVH
ncbi:hypothetical protein FEM03_12785 [Phragmitibacter flavus]|uniref:Uncharacterized protein n=1 Tax=Phragmitibacter flavus TaxID=2576071 RepID=A0A5R8KEC0_9BACT|nr:hypothetical protein [Phragmitibacter flavus]TLD70587.1 hypothetical protein FEM03_12785 [Phragmitibacter flavus]